MKKLTAKYELNIDDVLAFYLYKYKQRRTGCSSFFARYVDIACAVIALCIGLTVWIFENQLRPIAAFLIICAILLFLYHIISPLFLNKLLRLGVKKDYSPNKNRLIGKHKFSATPTKMIDISNVGETESSWAAIEYVVTTSQYLFLHVRASGPYIVPKKAFPDDQAFRRFAETVTAYHQAAVAEQTKTTS